MNATAAVDVAKREIEKVVSEIPESLRAGVTVRRATHDAITALGEYESALAILQFAKGSKR